MFIQRCFVFILLCFQFFVSAEDEPPRYNTCTSNTFEHEGDINNPNSRRSITLKNNVTTSIIQLSDKGRCLRAYDIITCDGYILTIFRMTFQNNETSPNKLPVLLVHGLYQSSDRFIEQRTDHSLAFLLQDLGYDVWLANTRGNKYGRYHIYLEPDKENVKFFNYSYEEIALYDIPLIIDYILNDTSKQKVHYISHSLGGTVFLVLNSMKPEYNSRFATAHLMAPIGYQNFFPNSDLADEANRVEEIYGNLMKKGKSEMFPYLHNVLRNNENENLQNVKFSVEDCLGEKSYQKICKQLKIDKFMDLNHNENSIDKTRGGSIKLLAHLAQNIKSKSFSRWDYGENENKKHYGTEESTKYNLSSITAKTKIIYAPNDEYVSPKDIADMAKDMAHATTLEVARKDFKHDDFIVAPDVMDVVYNDIIQDLWNTNRIIKRNIELAKEEPKKKQEEDNIVKQKEDGNEDDGEDEDEDDDGHEPEEQEKHKKKLHPRKPSPKFRPAGQNKKLFNDLIPTSWWIYVIFWLPKVIIPITICLCLLILFCCLKKIQTKFAVTLKNDKEEDEE